LLIYEKKYKITLRGAFMGVVYNKVLLFKKKYSGTVMWRLKKHCSVIERHLNPGEEVLYAFAGQLNDNPLNIYATVAIALTNKRILIGHKKLLFGYSLNSITPDLFNDMQVYEGIFFGKITIDTVKEVTTITNLSKKSLPEIETNISEYMMKEKQKYGQNKENKN
jgi:hypothetical protein